MVLGVWAVTRGETFYATTSHDLMGFADLFCWNA